MLKYCKLLNWTIIFSCLCVLPITALAAEQPTDANAVTDLVFIPEGSNGIKSLKLGMYGERVEELQKLLTEKGFLATEADGYFGRATDEAVTAFQKLAGLEVDGVVGQATLEALTDYEIATSSSKASDNIADDDSGALKLGVSGERVSYLQGYLTNAGYLRGEIDGTFGAATKAAVQAFQRDYGLTDDGVAGSVTLEALRSATPQVSRLARSIVMTATAYSAFDEGNGKYTHRGTFLCKGLAAVDPTVIPLGTRLYIPGYGYAIADDTGGAIGGSRIDLAFNSNDEAIDFGVRQVSVYILD